MNRKCWLGSRNGFTLVEILLVVVIIGVLAAMVIPNIAGRGEDARRAAAQADIDANLSAALDMYEMDNGKYPTTEQGLQALVTEPASSPVPRNWKGSYLKKKKVPQDPWGNTYVYRSPGMHNPDEYDLFSYGSDGIESSDDITNW
ncbi:MAG: type II secretion system major pseudopilin GspG [Candidatus Omnitrophica bacterium]|nr:type II secretion system major pseudopilin GspG [Candidatus Omnitrophota bacterium]